MPLRIGGNAIWGEYFQGQIDEVRVYNRAALAIEIQTDMVTPMAAAAHSGHDASDRCRSPRQSNGADGLGDGDVERQCRRQRRR